ncbi:MAG TPA: integration host factor, actinobacterial type [Acidimicrobiales bacterium]|nr:integration host factor, actinobacterial type [Acidimicrobiales bacterium]
MPTPPPLSDEQRRAALEKAAEARRVRAQLKADLQAGSLTLAEVFARADEDKVVADTKILTVLESLPNIGKVRSRRTLQELQISERQRVRGVGANQRDKLVERFEGERP